MNDEALAATKGSCEKWRNIVAGTGVDWGGTNCPLCKLFGVGECRGCPVREAVRDFGCGETPYVRWIHLHRKAPLPWRAETPEEIAAAKAELAFLESLLPREEEK